MVIGAFKAPDNFAMLGEFSEDWVVQIHSLAFLDCSVAVSFDSRVSARRDLRLAYTGKLFRKAFLEHCGSFFGRDPRGGSPKFRSLNVPNGGHGLGCGTLTSGQGRPIHTGILNCTDTMRPS